MHTELHWIDGPWRGKLAIAARPRGGDWLEDEIAGWRRSGIDSILSLLTADEESELGLKAERVLTRRCGMNFLSLPIRDRDVPDSEDEFRRALQDADEELGEGRNLVVHCRQGVGRSGLVAASLLANRGVGLQRAIEHISTTRGEAIPETVRQREWLDRFITTLAGVGHE